MTAKTYPIVPYEGEWGADIGVNGRPEWLPDGQWIELVSQGQKYDGTAVAWYWQFVITIRLPASHGYYADNPASDDVEIATARTMGYSSVREALEAFALSKTFDAFNLDTWLSETKANLPEIEAAGHSVTFAPDWAEQLLHDLGNNLDGATREEIKLKKLAIIRSRVRPVL